MNRRFWCIVCSLFLFYNLKVLFEDFYSVNYKIVEEDDKLHEDVINIAACTSFNDIALNNQEMNRNVIQMRPTRVEARSFLNLSILMVENRLGTKNLFSVDQSYIFRGHVCFLLNQTSYENNQSVKDFLKIYAVLLFVHSPGRQPFLYEYVYNNYHNNDSLKIVMQKVYGPRYLGSSNCGTHRDQFLTSQFNCLRNCPFSWPADFHAPDGDQLFELTHLINKRPVDLSKIQFGKDSDNETLKKCVARCPKEDCFSETYNSLTVANERMKIDVKSAIYKAYYSTPDFWSQLFGLITLFTGTSVIDTVPHLVSLAVGKLKKSWQIRFVRHLPKMKFFLVVFSSIVILYQSILTITDYQFEKSFPNRTIIWNFSSKPFSVVICLPIETLFYKDENISEARNAQMLKRFSFEQLEVGTRAFEKGVNEIHLLHGNQVKNLSWTMTKKVLFKSSSFDQVNCLARCFRIEPNFKDLKYRKMMPFHYLNIKFQSRFREVFVTEKHQSFTSGLVDFKGDYFVRKIEHKALDESRKSNCRHLSGEESEKNKRIDRCINKLFLKEHSALPVHSVVDKDDFGDEINGFKFKETTTTSIERICREKAAREQSSCKTVRFEESMNRMIAHDNSSVRLNLNYEYSINKEIGQSFIKVVLYILNLESIFFKNNFASCLLFLLTALKHAVKLNWSNGKIARFLVLSVCFLGFLVHNVFVFKGIIDGQLTQNGYFQPIHQFALPNVGFCFDLSGLKFDQNHKMTGGYLNSLTQEMRLANIVLVLLYFNRTHYNTVELKGGESNYSDSEITIRPLYLLDTFYCLEFQVNVKFDEDDFYILANKFILHIYFKNSFTLRTKKAYLFYRESGQKEVGDLVEFAIGPDQRGNQPIYEIVLELIKVERNDEFEDLKDPRRLFFGKRRTTDVNDYLNEMQAKFSSGNLKNFTTNEFLLEQADFDKEIDNNLFQQFFLQVMNVTDHQRPASLNYKLTHTNFYSKRIDLNINTYFQFTVLPISKRVEISNEDNFAKLIQNLLNTLSLWLNISISDLVVHLNWTLNLLLKPYYLLVTARAKLSSSDCFR